MFIESLLSLNKDFFFFWGYVIVFLALFIESLPFIGALIPGGTIILLVSGILTKFGFFKLWKILVVCILASILIDIFGYYLGRRIKKDVFHHSMRFLLIRREMFDRISRVIHGHTGKALIFGRLNPVTRSMAPFIVGTEEVPFVRFLFYNVVGGVLWVTMFIFIGYIFAGSLTAVKEMEHFIVITTLLLVGGFYIYYIINLFINGGYKRWR